MMHRKEREESESEGNGGGHEEPPLERENTVPPWQKQITLRAMGTSLVLSIVFNIIVCKLNLSTGVIPSLNVAAGLLGFSAVKLWTIAIEKCGLLKQPFTRQENTVIQTCVVASSGIAFSSGTASYLLGMSQITASQADTGNSPENVKELSLGWMTAFLFVVSFVGLFSIVPLRRVMILKYKLTYPSGTATAYLINSFHTPKGAKLAKNKFGFCSDTLLVAFYGLASNGSTVLLMVVVSATFLHSAFKPTTAGSLFNSRKQIGPFHSHKYWLCKCRFYFDFSATYVGVGMICPYMVNISLLIGAIISWGVLWPIIESKKGDWYGADIPSNSLHGIQGYRVFLAIAMILGDGLFQVAYISILTLQSFMQQLFLKQNALNESEQGALVDYNDRMRTDHFLREQIPDIVAIGGYVALATVSTFVIPVIFPQLKFYQVLVAYVIAPVLAFCNAYGCGLTDWSLASNYGGKLAILVFSSWVGLEEGGVLAGLASCGVMMSIVSTASDLMQDFKTGYLTLSSPRAMFISQVFGTAMGCILSPLVFWFFYKAYKVGDPTGSYPAPYALMYRGIALLGVEGMDSLPKNCIKLVVVCFVSALMINGLIQVLKKYERKYRIYRVIPSPMCMAIPFYLGGYFAIDMCVGSLILFVWQMKNKKQAAEFGPAVASGLICGESLWGIPAAILALAGVNPPICMKFVSRSVNNRLDSLLGD